MKPIQIYLFLSIVIAGLSIWIFLHPVKEQEQFDKGFNEGIATVGKTVTRIQDKYDSVVNITNPGIQTQIKYITKINYRYDTIFISIDTISYDSSIFLRSKLRSDFRGFYRSKN